MRVGEELCTRPAVLHGGAVMALADTLGAIATVANLPEGTTTTTIESKTNFFAAIPAGDTARAECTPLHRGLPPWCGRPGSRVAMDGWRR